MSSSGPRCMVVVEQVTFFFISRGTTRTTPTTACTDTTTTTTTRGRLLGFWDVRQQRCGGGDVNRVEELGEGGLNPWRRMAHWESRAFR